MSDQNPLDRYMNSLSDYDQARTKVEDIAQRVRSIAEGLRNWEVVGIRDSKKVLGESFMDTPNVSS